MLQDLHFKILKLLESKVRIFVAWEAKNFLFALRFLSILPAVSLSAPTPSCSCFMTISFAIMKYTTIPVLVDFQSSFPNFWLN